MNFSSFRLSKDILSLRALRDTYLHRTSIFISDSVVSVLKDICNQVKSHSVDVKEQCGRVTQSLKTFQIREFIKNRYDCGTSDNDQNIDNFYHELDIFINLEIRLIAYAAFNGFDRMPRYDLRASYYEFLNHLYEVGRTVIVSETASLEQFLMGRNRQLIRQLIQTYREELVAFAPVPNKDVDLYRAQSVPVSVPSALSTSQQHQHHPSVGISTPRVRFQHNHVVKNKSSVPSRESSRPLVFPTTAAYRENFLDGGNDTMTTAPPSPLQNLMSQPLTLSHTSQSTMLPMSVNTSKEFLI